MREVNPCPPPSPSPTRRPAAGRAFGHAGVPLAEDVFLPFEGDRTLSIVLSKAFLLAEDAKIEDPAITRQIGRA